MIKYDYFGDDLGTMYFTFWDCTLAKAVNYVIDNIKDDKYKIVSIKEKKRWFRSNLIRIVLEDPAEIKSLEGTQHYSKSYADV